ncbi:MAG: pilin [Betaproteobacteria bacterium]|nr:pilin [Betaproteobacteria bacterium]
MPNPSTGAHFRPKSGQTPRGCLTLTCQCRVRTHTGFTLIELVMVISIVAVLALMALPSIYGQTARNQIKESIPLMDLVKRGVANAYYANREMPADNAAARVPAADKIVGNYVSAVTVKDGAVTMTFGNSVTARLKGKKLTVRPAVVQDEPSVPIAWVCAKKAVPEKMTAMGSDETNIDGEALPIDCR